MLYIRQIFFKAKKKKKQLKVKEDEQNNLSE